MTYLEKATRSALIVNSNGEATRLKRLPFMQSSFNEAWLQELIENNSFLLPSGEISPKYSQLVCIGREVPVGSGETQGYIDNLYITPTGEIVIVETKLFRNQEARRTVIAQIIDYAKDVQKWDASRLNEIASDYYYRKIGQSCNLIDVMARNGYLSLSDEGELIDRLNANLQSASFLLMIVGDGIRTGVQQLVDFLNDNASMAFDLALVELEIYQHNEDTIVIPNVSLKTSLVERYNISSGSSAESKDDPVGSTRYVRKPILSRKEFISVFSENGGYDSDRVSELISDLELIDGMLVEIAPTELTVRFKLEDGYNCVLLTFSISGGHSDLYVMPGRLRDALEKHGRFPFEAEQFLDFFKQFINVKRCKTPPYEYAAGFYYANIDDVLDSEGEIIAEAEKFVSSIR